MANPQCENGYMRLATELVDQFAKLKLSGSEWRILWAVWRKTYGFQKLQDHIPLTQLEQLTGLSRQGVCKAKKHLVNKRILLLKENSIKFNKKYNEWVVNNRLPSKQLLTKGSQQNGNQLVNKKTHSIDSSSKDIFKDNNRVVLFLFGFWQWCMEKTNRSKLTSDRRLKIKARLKTYSPFSIIWAICGCGASDFHQGKNDNNKKYNDITLICRNDSKIEGFQEYISEKDVDNYINQFTRESAEWLKQHNIDPTKIDLLGH